MELSSAEGALRTLKHRPKVPLSAVQTSTAILTILTSSPTPPEASSPAPADDEARREQLQTELQTLLIDGHERWEPIAVFLVVVRDLLSRYLHVPDLDASLDLTPRAPDSCLYVSTIAPFSRDFVTHNVQQVLHQYLEYYEPRVRMAVAKLLGVLAKWDLPWVTGEFTPHLIDSIHSNLSRSPDFEETGFEDVDDNVSTNGMVTPPQSPEGTPRTPSTPYRLDDVSGWKALETSLCGLKYIMQGSGVAYFQVHSIGANQSFVYLTPSILELVATKSCFHVNRHVRVVGFDTLTILSTNAPFASLDALLQPVSDVLATCLQRGLQDNWCQVRYAASIAARAFLVHVPAARRPVYNPTLLPRLCLNRYYIAERVQKHAQDSWQELVGDRGRDLVAQYAPDFVAYYVAMTTHCVRESACHCIAELATKVDARAIRPHVAQLMHALLVCFYDVSNLVRDAACLATAQLVVGFPSDCRPFLDDLYPLWIAHLADEIWSVREDAAIALGHVVRAYGLEAQARVVAVVEAYLPMAKRQAPMTQHEYDERMRSEKHHLSKQAFSCCSLEPKVVTRHNDRVKELWEHTDGAIYLVRELCTVAPDVAVTFLPVLADIAILRHYPQTAVLQETIWKQLPAMGQALGKQVLKRYLELFFDPLVFTLQGSHRLAKFAARECVAQLSHQIGPSIFRGRLDGNPVWKETLGPVVPVQSYMIK